MPSEPLARARSKIGAVMPVSIKPGQMALTRTPVPARASAAVCTRLITPAFDALLDLLIPFNASWAKEAAALVVILSNSLMRPPGQDKDVPSRSHSFDAGAAWMSFALQAQMRGWHTHGMVGVDFDRAFAELDVPQGYRVECAVALGRIGDPAGLPEQLRAREQPNDRQPLSAIAMEGRFKG